MMFDFVKRFFLAVLKVPPEPDDPMGDVDTLKIFRASPRYYTYRLILWAGQHLMGLFSYGIVALVIFIGAIAELSKPNASAAGAIVMLAFLFIGLISFVIGLVISYFVLRLDYEMRWYKVTDRSLRIREGVFNVREMTLTFANIQNISITQGPIQRILGIADLKLETAGGGKRIIPNNNAREKSTFKMHEAYFKGIDNPDEVRDLVMSRLRKMRDSGLGDSQYSEEDESDNKSLSVSDEKIVILRSIKDESTNFANAAEMFAS